MNQRRSLVSIVLTLALLGLAVYRALGLAPLATISAAPINPRIFMPVTAHSTYVGPASTRLYGVLQSDVQHFASDWQAGVRARTFELGWDYYEPQPGAWSQSYVDSRKAEYKAMRDAGYLVVLDLGLQYPPEWARAMRPWVDQYGNTYDGQANTIFSPAVREHVAAYIHRVFQDFGTDFYGVRLGSGSFIETLYPDTPAGFQFSYWAFDADALAANPVPGWRPGQPSPSDEARTFYTWYLQRLIDTMNWQQDVVRQSFGGYLIQLMPGQGLRPNQWDGLIASNLIPTGQNIYAAERGAAWDRIIDGMRDRTNVIINCSSVGDASATDEHVSEFSSNPVKWSSAHWVAYNADRYGMPKWAENPGNNSVDTMQVVFDQVGEFGYDGLFWAFEADLHSGQYATLDQYAAMIAKNR